MKNAEKIINKLKKIGVEFNDSKHQPTRFHSHRRGEFRSTFLCHYNKYRYISDFIPWRYKGKEGCHIEIDPGFTVSEIANKEITFVTDEEDSNLARIEIV